MRAILASAALAAMLPGCRHNYVKVDDMALGRVVVYRNGVAYYERRATLKGESLAIQVPYDKVNDFLKSLTVRDARTGKPLPVGFPSPAAAAGGMVSMEIDLPRGAPTDLIITYITEAPAWKPSYRLMVDRKGAVRLQGWAIVDNTSGEDWTDVRVGVGSSSALSFRYDLWSVRDVVRETLTSDDRFAVAPPTGTSPYGTPPDGGEAYAFSDDELPRPDSHPVVQEQKWQEEADEMEESIDAAPMASSGGSSRGGGGESASVTRSAPAKPPEVVKREQGREKVKTLAHSIKNKPQRYVVEGFAKKGEADPEARALDRANVLRNQLIEEGVPPAQLEVRNGNIDKDGKAVAADTAGVRLVALPRTREEEAAGGKGATAAEDDRPVGESHFESKTPMTVERQRSVMVSIVDQATPGETVYLYDAESARGNQRFAFKAIRFENPTHSALEAGPVTVYDHNGFVGEGLTDPIPGDAIAIVPFALDRQVVVDRVQKAEDRITRLVTLSRGVLTSEVSYVRRSSYDLTNRLNRPVTVYVRHTVADGWNLGTAPAAHEKVGDAHLFKVALAPRETKAIAVEESTPMTRTLDLRSPSALDMVALYLTQPVDDPGLATPMKTLLALNKEMADHQSSIDNLRQRLGDYRVRMDELHAQIVTLQAVKSGGNLMKHLKQKMTEVSELVQKGTIDLVNREERLMLARIRFQDAIAELTLGGKSDPKVGSTR
ncbi:MAG TPA: hypothetical protein VMZ28_26235 [Kofleriaceae bacterium]|nr:hypothetical protein [Kofleriaceae bacterium]